MAASFDSRRVEALDLVEVVADLDEAIAVGPRRFAAGRRPAIVHTSRAKRMGVSYAAMRENG